MWGSQHHRQKPHNSGLGPLHASMWGFKELHIQAQSWPSPTTWHAAPTFIPHWSEGTHQHAKLGWFHATGCSPLGLRQLHSARGLCFQWARSSLRAYHLLLLLLPVAGPVLGVGGMCWGLLPPPAGARGGTPTHNTTNPTLSYPPPTPIHKPHTYIHTPATPLPIPPRNPPYTHKPLHLHNLPTPPHRPPSHTHHTHSPTTLHSPTHIQYTRVRRYFKPFCNHLYRHCKYT